MNALISAGQPVLAPRRGDERCASVPRAWVWLVPCWVWKYFFLQCSREAVRLNGRLRLLVRLDGEFALVYDPIDRQQLWSTDNEAIKTS